MFLLLAFLFVILISVFVHGGWWWGVPAKAHRRLSPGLIFFFFLSSRGSWRANVEHQTPQRTLSLLSSLWLPFVILLRIIGLGHAKIEKKPGHCGGVNK